MWPFFTTPPNSRGRKRLGPLQESLYYELPCSISDPQHRLQTQSRPIKKRTGFDFVMADTSPSAPLSHTSDFIPVNNQEDSHSSEPSSGAFNGCSNVDPYFSPHPTSHRKPRAIELSGTISLGTSYNTPKVFYRSQDIQENDTVPDQPTDATDDNPYHCVDAIGADNPQYTCDSSSLHPCSVDVLIPTPGRENSENSLAHLSFESDRLVSCRGPFNRNQEFLTQNTRLIDENQDEDDNLHTANKEAMSVCVGQQALQGQLENVHGDEDPPVETNLQKDDNLVLELEEAGNLEDEKSSPFVDDIAKLRNELDLAHADLAKEADMKLQTKNQLEVCRREKEALLKDHGALKEDLEIVRKEFEVFRTEATSSLQEKDRLRSKLHASLLDANKTVEELQWTKDRLSATNKKYSLQVRISRAEIDYLKEDKEDLKKELAELEKRVQYLETEKDDAQWSQLHTQSKLKQALRKLKAQQEEYERVDQQLDKSEKRVESLTDDNQNLQDMLNRSQAKLKGSQSDLNELQERFTRLQRTAWAWHQENNWLQGKLSEAREAESETRSELKASQADLSGLQERFTRLQRTAWEWHQKNNRLQGQLSEARKAESDTLSELKTSQADLNGLQERFARLRRTAWEWHLKNNQLEEELSDARETQSETLSELKTTRARIRSYVENITELELNLKLVKQKKQELKSEFQAAQVRFKREVASMSNRLETLERQLYKAQRHIRSFDQMSSFQQEIRSSSDYESIRRCKNYSPSSKGSQVINLVKQLNSATYQFAQHFASEENVHFFKTSPTPPSKRAKALLGEPVLALLQGHANEREYSGVRLVLEVVVRMFLVAWCMGIIEGWYPKRQNFLDLLIKFNAPQPDSQELTLLSRAKTQIITKSAGADYHAWVDDILGDLSALLQNGGIGIFPTSYEELSDHLLPILKEAYTIRTALAEKDLYGNLEVYLVTFRTAFQPSCVDKRYTVYDKLKETPYSNPWEEKYVIGNVSLGLEVNESERQDEDPTLTRVVLNPEVVVSSLDMTHDKPTYSLLNS